MQEACSTHHRTGSEVDRIGMDAAFLEGDGVRVPAMHKEKFARRAPFDAERKLQPSPKPWAEM